MAEIIQANVTGFKGRIEAYGVWLAVMTAFDRDFNEVQVVVDPTSFPCGLLMRFLRECPPLDAVIERGSELEIATALPFANQRDEVVSFLNTCAMDHYKGKSMKLLERLPELDLLQLLTVVPHPKASELNALLRIEIEEPDIGPEEPLF